MMSTLTGRRCKSCDLFNAPDQRIERPRRFTASENATLQQLGRARSEVVVSQRDRTLGASGRRSQVVVMTEERTIIEVRI
jgi:hypothetical protein